MIAVDHLDVDIRFRHTAAYQSIAAIVRANGFSNAGAILHLSQPAVSRRRVRVIDLRALCSILVDADGELMPINS
jgi:hypothetical protein